MFLLRHAALKLQRVQLPEQAFDPLAHLFAFGSQGFNLLHQAIQDRALRLDLLNLRFETVQLSLHRNHAFFSGDARLALTADQRNGAQHPHFKRRKIVGGKHRRRGSG